MCTFDGFAYSCHVHVGGLPRPQLCSNKSRYQTLRMAPLDCLESMPAMATDSLESILLQELRRLDTPSVQSRHVSISVPDTNTSSAAISHGRSAIVQHNDDDPTMAETVRETPQANSTAESRPQPSSRHVILNKACVLFQHFKKLWNILLHRWWIWEVSALVISCICMTAAVVVLLHVNDKLLAEWKFPIQLNSLLSVLITISKSALLVSTAECISQAKWIQFQKSPLRLNSLQQFDDASRGPWGSLQFLFGPKVAGSIAFLGAFLTIASLALDPFTQQIVAFPSRIVESSNGTATFAATQSFTRVDDKAMRGAVFNGVYTSKLSPETVHCSTAECKWTQPITSLGVCSLCRDMTAVSHAVCQTQPGPLQPDEGDDWSFSSTSCTMTVNNSITFDVHMQTLSLPGRHGRHPEYASQYTETKMIPSAWDLGWDTLGNGKLEPLQLIVGYTTFFDHDQETMPKMTLQVLDPQVTACGLYLCGQVFENVTVTNGTLVTVDPSESFILKAEMNDDGDFVYKQTADGGVAVLSIPDQFKSRFPGDPTFLLSYNIALPFSNFLGSVFNVTTSSGNDDFHAFPEANTNIYEITDAMYQDQNISETFARLAKSVTDQLRISEGGHMVSGIALDKQTFVEVRWLWMILPLLVLVLASGLLAATVWTAAKQKAPVWKSSTLAVLLHNLDGLRDEDLRISTLEDLERLAERIDVTLEQGHGRRLVVDRRA